MEIKTNHLLGAVLCLLVIFTSTTTAPAQTPDNRIVFSYAITGQIHAMNPDGSGMVQLTSGGGTFPAWSHNKRYVLFHRSTSAENTIYIMEALGEDNGGRIFPVATDGGDTGPDWSPDATMIVYAGTHGIQDGLWIVAVNPDTEELGTPILVRAGVAAAPVWSPDGTKVAFVSYPGAIIKILELATGVESFGISGYAPSFSPDGSRVAFRGTGPVTKGGKTTWHAQIFVANVDGTGIQQLTSQTDYVNFPRWSSDSTQLVFWHQANGLNSIRKLTLATHNAAPLSSGDVGFPICGSGYEENPRGSPYDFSFGAGGAAALQNIPVASGDQIILAFDETYRTAVGLNFTITLTPDAVDPVAAIEDLATNVVEMNLQNGIENSLDSKLDAVLNALGDANVSNDGAACNSLAAFICAVEAQRGGKITSAQADQLIAAAQVIRGQSNCAN